MKALDDYFADWEGWVFGYGYGSGEAHVLPALKRFLALCEEGGGYDYQRLEGELGPAVVWLLINALARTGAIDYGTSPRYGWLTAEGKSLKIYVGGETDEGLIETVCGRDENYIPCYPDACNCGPWGYEEGRSCPNPFWKPWVLR